jgi:ribonuclease P protein component
MSARQPGRLRRRAEFVATAGGVRVNSRFFSLQARSRDESGPARLGFTVTRRAGGAVERNRMRRRLREAAKAAFASLPDDSGDSGMDFVVVARSSVLGARFDSLVGELVSALRRAPEKVAKATSPRSESGNG